MRLIDADALIKRIPTEDIGSMFAVKYAPTAVGQCYKCKHSKPYCDDDLIWCTEHETIFDCYGFCNSYKEFDDRSCYNCKFYGTDCSTAPIGEWCNDCNQWSEVE